MSQIEHFENTSQKGQEAKKILNNPVFKNAIQVLEMSIIEQIDSCDPIDKEKTQKVVLKRQIYLDFIREFYRLVEDGDLCDQELSRLNKSEKKPTLVSDLQR